MNYLEIDPREIKLAGAGAKLQWGMVIGIAIDALPKLKQRASGPDLLNEIKSQLAKPNVLQSLSDPSKFNSEHKATLDAQLKGAGSKLSSADLQKVFAGASGKN